MFEDRGQGFSESIDGLVGEARVEGNPQARCSAGDARRTYRADVEALRLQRVGRGECAIVVADHNRHDVRSLTRNDDALGLERLMKPANAACELRPPLRLGRQHIEACRQRRRNRRRRRRGKDE